MFIEGRLLLANVPIISKNPFLSSHLLKINKSIRYFSISIDRNISSHNCPKVLGLVPIFPSPNIFGSITQFYTIQQIIARILPH